MERPVLSMIFVDLMIFFLLDDLMCFFLLTSSLL
jgi:hypothetical protein